MARAPFGWRFGYALWLYHLRQGRALKWSEIGNAVGRTGQAVSAWPELDEAPSDWKIQAPLAELLNVGVDWLIKAQGDPPLPELWALWLAERRRAERMPASSFRPAGEKTPAAKKRA